MYCRRGYVRSPVHRGQTCRAIFHCISRDFIHNEVETLARVYIIAVECKRILISPTQTGFFTFLKVKKCSAPGQKCFDKWRQQVRICQFPDI